MSKEAKDTDAPMPEARRSTRRTTAKKASADKAAKADKSEDKKKDPKADKTSMDTEGDDKEPSSPGKQGAMTPESAATHIQALVRGAKVRQKVKEELLWDTWNKLDWKEESELMQSHQAYENMVKAVDEKKKAAAETKAAETKPTSSKAEEAKKKAAAAAAAQEKKQSQKAMDDDGLTLTDPIKLDFVTAMLDHFKANKQLDPAHVIAILERVKPILKKQPNIVDISVHTRITVVGDLHGQLDDLLHIFKLNGLPSQRNAYLFNGDFVDRGQHSCECALTLFAFKLLYPQYLHLNRGNHEARDINSRDGFEKEVLVKYNAKIFNLFSDVFACLPIASILERKVFVVHGGLFWKDVKLAEIQAQNRFYEIPPTDSLQEQMLWSDPDPEPGRKVSPRGAALLFGPEVTAAFLKLNKLQLVVRSHECMQHGYDRLHDDTVITVFSASNYCGTVGNEGAFVIFEKDMVPNIVQYYAKPKERLSRYRMRVAMMETDIIAKLLQRIADNRLALINYYRTVEKVIGGIHTVQRQQWQDGLQKVLKINIKFLEFQDYLGLPKLGVDGRKKGPIDYMAFLLRYRPINDLMKKAVWRSDDGGKAQREAKQSLEVLMEMLHKHRFELESLFRHFDQNGDESISVAEFKDGILSLQGMMETKFTESEIDNLIKVIDANSDGFISYSEFFDGFRLVDPALAETQAKQKKQKKSLGRKSGNGSLTAKGEADNGDDSSMDTKDDTGSNNASGKNSPTAKESKDGKTSPRGETGKKGVSVSNADSDSDEDDGKPNPNKRQKVENPVQAARDRARDKR